MRELNTAPTNRELGGAVTELELAAYTANKFPEEEVLPNDEMQIIVSSMQIALAWGAESCAYE